MNRSSIPLFLICAANIFPVLIGLIFYPIFIENLLPEYTYFTLAFWTLMAVSFCYLNAKKIDIAIANLRQDMADPRTVSAITALSVTAVVLIVANIDWLADARSIGIDVRSFRFKIFFLFEDIFFVLLVYYFCSIILKFRVTNVLWFVGILTGMVLVFGRFGLVVGQILGLIILRSKSLVDSAARKVLMATVLIGTIAGIYLIENIRADDLSSERLTGSEATLNFVDRLGEFGTLGVTGRIFERPDHSGFAGFENLAYLYLPSVLFAEKPVVEGGAAYLEENFNLGSGNEIGEGGTRFPIMLHVDSYRRFGWMGLIFAVLPGLLVRMSFTIFQFLRTKLSIPLIEIIILKYSVFMYPKSIIGIIELFLYTTIRSFFVLFLIVFVIRIFGIKARRARPQKIYRHVI